MTLRKNTLRGEGTGSVGTAAATGTPFTAATGDWVFDAEGLYGRGAVTGAGAVASYGRYTLGAGVNAFAGRIYFKPSALNVDWTGIAIGHGGSSFTSCAKINVHTTGYVRVYDKSSSSIHVWASALQLPDTTSWYMLELVAILGATNTTGTIIASYRKAGDANPIQTWESNGNRRLDLTAFDTIRLGKTTGSALQVRLSEFAWDDGRTTLIGVEPAPVVPPTIVTVGTNGLARINVSGSTSGNGTALTFGLSPSPLLTVAPGDWIVQQTLVEQTFTVTVTQSGVDYTTQVVVPPLAVAGNTIYLPSRLVKTS